MCIRTTKPRKTHKNGIFQFLKTGQIAPSYRLFLKVLIKALTKCFYISYNKYKPLVLF